MININILTKFPDYHCYLDDNVPFMDSGDYRFYENSQLDIIWDLVVVVEGINESLTFKVKSNGLWFVSGEPPMSREYPKAFLRQFDLQITSHKYKNLDNVLNTQQSLDWWYAKSFKNRTHKYTLAQIEQLPISEKTKNISLISSSKKMMPGHNHRQSIIKQLKKDFPTQIDFYGGVDGDVEYKCDAIDDYRFCICIENSQIDDYWTEKIADPILGYSIPIYSGCTNIDSYFNKNGMFVFDVKNYNTLKRIIEMILENPESEYDKKVEFLKQNRSALVDYHMFNSIKRKLEGYGLSQENKNVNLKPAEEFDTYKWLYLRTRFIRACYKFVLNIF